MLVLLYLAIPSSIEGLPVVRRLRGRVRAALARRRDLLRWRLESGYTIDYDAWRNSEHTNKGDVAIRQAIRAQLSTVPNLAPITFEEVLWGELSDDHVARLNAAASLFVIGGGGYFFLDQNNQLASRVARDTSLIRRITCTRIAYGVGVNQLIFGDGPRAPESRAVPDTSAATLRDLLASLDVVSVRDTATHQLLTPLTSRQIHLAGDPALFLGGKAGPTAAAKPAGRMMVGLNFALHGRNSARTLPERMSWIVPLLHTLRQAWSCDFRYFVHSDTEWVFAEILRMRGIIVDAVDCSVDDTIAAYRTVDLHICQMLHSSILSLGAGVPTLNVAYDAKNLEFFKLLGVEDYCIAPQDASAALVAERANQLRARSAEVMARVSSRKAALAAETDRTLRQIADAVGKSVQAQHA